MHLLVIVILIDAKMPYLLQVYKIYMSSGISNRPKARTMGTFKFSRPSSSPSI